MISLLPIICSSMQSPSLIPNFRLILAGMVILPFWSTFVCSPILGHLHVRCFGLLMKITVPKCSNGVPSLLRRRCLMLADRSPLYSARFG